MVLDKVMTIQSLCGEPFPIPFGSPHAVNLIERYEIKYLLPERMVPRVRAHIAPYCKRDKYANAEGFYAIRSLYLDTANYDLFWANAREQRDRFKARIRNYPGKSSPVFFEVKRRVGDVIVKSRAVVPEKKWLEVLLNSAFGTPIDNKHLARFIDVYQRYHLEPRVLVEYEREPYESLYDNYARVTFDRRIICQEQRGLSLEADPHRWRPVDHRVQTWTSEPVCVLELKFERRPPRWMSDMIRNLELTRMSFSKYCYSVTSEYLMPSARGALVHGAARKARSA